MPFYPFLNAHLILSFLLLTGLYAKYRNTKRIVDSIFRLEKSDVYNAAMADYTILIKDIIPTISSENGNFDLVFSLSCPKGISKNFHLLKIVFL